MSKHLRQSESDPKETVAAAMNEQGFLFQQLIVLPRQACGGNTVLRHLRRARTRQGPELACPDERCHRRALAETEWEEAGRSDSSEIGFCEVVDRNLITRSLPAATLVS